MRELFGPSQTKIVEHIGHIYEENELDLESTYRKFRPVQIENTPQLPDFTIHTQNTQIQRIWALKKFGGDGGTGDYYFRASIVEITFSGTFCERK